MPPASSTRCVNLAAHWREGGSERLRLMHVRDRSVGGRQVHRQSEGEDGSHRGVDRQIDTYMPGYRDKECVPRRPSCPETASRFCLSVVEMSASVTSVTQVGAGRWGRRRRGGGK